MTTETYCAVCEEPSATLAPARFHPETMLCPECLATEPVVQREGDEPLIPTTWAFTLADSHDAKETDGEPVDVAEFIEVNGFAMPDVEQIAGLKVGEAVYYGGGAAQEFVLRRVS